MKTRAVCPYWSNCWQRRSRSPERHCPMSAKTPSNGSCNGFRRKTAGKPHCLPLSPGNSIVTSLARRWELIRHLHSNGSPRRASSEETPKMDGSITSESANRCCAISAKHCPKIWMKCTPDWPTSLLLSKLDLISTTRRPITANPGEITNASASIMLSARNPIDINTKRSTHFYTPFVGDGDLPIGLRALCDNVDAKKIQKTFGNWQTHYLKFTAPMIKLITGWDLNI